MTCLQRLPAVTARSILKFIQSLQTDTAKKGAEQGWFTCYSEQIKKMNTSHEELIKHDSSNKLKLGIDLEQLNTKKFHSEMGICHKFQPMQAIMSNQDSKDKGSEVERLRNEILDTNSRALSNLSVIHQVLVGQTVTNPTEKGLLEKWSQLIYNNMRRKPMSAKMYQDYIDKYLDKFAIIQFRGILLYTEANPNSRYYAYKLFENNLKSQIETMEKTVPAKMKWLTDPSEKDMFVLRPVLDGKDEPYVRSKGLNRRLGYDYMCGYQGAGKWLFQKSPNFHKDGSLLIIGSSNRDKCYYISASEKNEAECVSEDSRATPFFVIPLEFKDNSMRIIFCKSNYNPKDKRFLGTGLTFIDGNDNIEFNLSYDCA